MRPTERPLTPLLAIAISLTAVAPSVASVESNMRSILMAMRMYAMDHKGAYPDDLQKVSEYVNDVDNLLTHPTTGVNPAFHYVPPATNIGFSIEPVLYERPPAQATSIAIGYQGGRVARFPPPRVVDPSRLKNVAAMTTLALVVLLVIVGLILLILVRRAHADPYASSTGGACPRCGYVAQDEPEQ
ncbi:MAG: hypothetical protein CMJ18_27125 [Phycisphaeraceae bacterium]|nr:hypothetical protein [Phycisphaeraceae bacterium]